MRVLPSAGAGPAGSTGDQLPGDGQGRYVAPWDAHSPNRVPAVPQGGVLQALACAGHLSCPVSAAIRAVGQSCWGGAGAN